MASPYAGVITNNGINEAYLADTNGWKIDFSKFAVSSEVGALDVTRTTANTIVYEAVPSAFVKIDSNSIRITCEIPAEAEYPAGTPTGDFTIREVYLFITNKDDAEKLFWIGQPIPLPYTEVSDFNFDIIINLNNISETSTFTNTQATEVSNHNNDPNAHPHIKDVIEKAGGLYQNPAVNYEFTSQWVDYYNVTFDGSVIDGDWVYKSEADNIYYKAIVGSADSYNLVGYADVTEGLVRFGGLVNTGHAYDAGTRLYLSATTAGVATDTETDVFLGVTQTDGVMLVFSAGGTGGAGTDEEYIEANIILNNSVYTQLYYDDFKDTTTVTTDATWDGADSGWTGATSDTLETQVLDTSATTFYHFTLKADIDTEANISFEYSLNDVDWVSFDLNEIIYVAEGFTDMYIRATWSDTATMKNLFFLYDKGATGNNEYIPHLNEVFSPSADILAGEDIVLPISSPYIQNNNALAVYVNGKRRDDVTEIDGYTIQLGIDVYTTDVIRIEEVAIPPSFIGVNSSAYIVKLPNIQALKDYNPYQNDVAIEVLGYYTEGDGGGGTFHWNPDNTDADNGGTIIQRTAGGDGRFERVYSGLINIKWFGAKADDNTFDNGAIIQSIYDSGIRSFYAPKGKYYWSTPVSCTNNTSISQFYSLAGLDIPTLVIKGDGSQETIFLTENDSFSGVDYFMQINTNEDDLSTDAYAFNINIEGISFRGSGATNTMYGLKLRGLWHGKILDVQCKFFNDGMSVDGVGTPSSDDYDTMGYIHLDQVVLNNNNDCGFKAIVTRPAGLRFTSCELRNNGSYGYRGGGAGISFDNCSISLNGSSDYEGGISIEPPASGSIPRGFSIRGCTLEANHGQDIWIKQVKGCVIDGNIFTPYDLSLTSNKCMIRVLETATTTNKLQGVSITNNQIQNWSIDAGNSIYWVYSMANFGDLANIKESNNNFGDGVASGSTIKNMTRYVFGSLDVSQWKVEADYNAIIPATESDIVDITGGTNSFSSSNASILSILDTYTDDFNYTGTGTFKIIKDGFYDINIVLPITGLTASHSGIVLDVRVNSIQRLVIERELALDNGQYDVPMALNGKIWLNQNDSVAYNCRISGSDTTPVNLASNGMYLFSITASR
ncbi:hypothetical protein [uncultured Arcobacter sp.]|uniref:hypothetical protein n=1 Tax=uncultured Arcobacter sp. TaxID=165434 RepID=UPI00260E3601|nr:hypothetical protein [uncultured Arcobacter sp.]